MITRGSRSAPLLRPLYGNFINEIINFKVQREQARQSDVIRKSSPISLGVVSVLIVEALWSFSLKFDLALLYTVVGKWGPQVCSCLQRRLFSTSECNFVHELDHFCAALCSLSSQQSSENVARVCLPEVILFCVNGNGALMRVILIFAVRKFSDIAG
jgi:hypothetical protein